jgi:SAM-dependent methyltransferase
MSSDYFNYLKNRSKLGLIYRKYFLYPKIYKYLNGKILDIGCGVGDFLKLYNHVSGVDINEDCVNYCIQNGLNVKLMAQDVLPFKDNSFNSIILDNVLEHIDNPTNLISEITRVLTPNGILVIGVPCEKGYKYDVDHKVFYDINGIKNLFNNSFIYYYHFYTPPFTFLFRTYFRQVALYTVLKLNK